MSEKVASRAESEHSRPVIRTIVSGEVAPRARSQKLTSCQEAATEHTGVRRKAESGVECHNLRPVYRTATEDSEVNGEAAS